VLGMMEGLVLLGICPNPVPSPLETSRKSPPHVTQSVMSGPFSLRRKKKPNGSTLPEGASALDSARTIRWLMSTSKPNGRIQCNVLTEGYFEVDDGFEENLLREKNNNQPKEEKKKEERKLIAPC